MLEFRIDYMMAVEANFEFSIFGMPANALNSPMFLKLNYHLI